MTMRRLLTGTYAPFGQTNEGARDGLSENPYSDPDSPLDAVRAPGKDGKQWVRSYPRQECSRWDLTEKRLTGKVPRWEPQESLIL